MIKHSNQPAFNDLTVEGWLNVRKRKDVKRVERLTDFQDEKPGATQDYITQRLI